MPKARFNKDITGYLILSILAEADGNFDASEGSVIVEYIRKNFPLGSNLEDATTMISELSPADYNKEIVRLAEDFYQESSDKERTKFLRFAMKLVRADNEVAPEENVLITSLFAAWDI